MQAKILADESVNFNIVQFLGEQGYTVYSNLEEKAGINDLEVISLAKEMNIILLTEDKDFGEWVFAYHIKNISVILLRYNSLDLDQIKQNLVNLLAKYSNTYYNKFIVIKKDKYRIRHL